MAELRHMAVAAGAGIALWLSMSDAARALTGRPCVVVQARELDFVPVLPASKSPGYYSAFYSIGSNNTQSLKPKAGDGCDSTASLPVPRAAPASTADKKSALLLMPPRPRLRVAAKLTEADLADFTPPVAPIAAKAPKPPQAAVSEAPAAPLPVPVQTVAPAEVSVEKDADEADYSEPSHILPVAMGLGVAAVVTYTLFDALDDDKSEPSRLSVASEPVQANVAYDAGMLASFAALNTVADLQSDQRISLGLSSSVYDSTAAIAAGMSLRLGAQGVFKTAVSFSGHEYLANAGVSYGW